MNFNQAVEYICDIQKFAKKNTLEHTRSFLKLLGNPCRDAKIIHVAGTNGKGSVCNYLRELLQSHGYSTGMFISPHLVDMRERILLNGKMVSQEQFLRAYETVKQVTDTSAKEKGLYHPTFFEFLFLMAMCVFEEEKPDYIILETGMGGRLDATNVFDKPQVTIITEIGLDHVQYLGETMEEIAMEKAGIIKDNVPLVYVSRRKNVARILSQRANECKSVSYPIDKTRCSVININDKSIDFSYKSSYYSNVKCTLSTTALYQVENAAAALTAFEILLEKEGIDLACMKSALKKAAWAGRMEEVMPGVFIDGAHNKDGIDAFLESVKHRENGKEKYLLFSVVTDKEFTHMISAIEESGLFFAYVIAGISDSRGADGGQIRSCFMKSGADKIYLCENVKEAYEQALDLKGDGELYIAGSLYLAGEIKAML